MRIVFGKHIGLMALLLLAGLALAVLPGGALADDGPAQVRMTVDPTVLPLVGPDGESQAPAEPAPPAKAGDEAAPESAPAPPDAPAPAPESATTAEPAPAPASAPKPAQAPKPTPKPAPAPVPEAKPAPVPAGKAGVITALALKSDADGFVLTITADRPVGDTSYLNLANPRRLVIDLRQPWTLRTRNVIRADGGAVRHVVAGEHPDRLRFVVHFRKVPGGKTEPEFTRSGNTLTVRVATP